MIKEAIIEVRKGGYITYTGLKSPRYLSTPIRYKLGLKPGHRYKVSFDIDLSES